MWIETTPHRAVVWEGRCNNTYRSYVELGAEVTSSLHVENDEVTSLVVVERIFS